MIRSHFDEMVEGSCQQLMNMVRRFRDRTEGGRLLAKELSKYADDKEVLI